MTMLPGSNLTARAASAAARDASPRSSAVRAVLISWSAETALSPNTTATAAARAITAAADRATGTPGARSATSSRPVALWATTRPASNQALGSTSARGNSNSAPAL
jgi:hypothetical protein